MHKLAVSAAEGLKLKRKSFFCITRCKIFDLAKKVERIFDFNASCSGWEGEIDQFLVAEFVGVEIETGWDWSSFCIIDLLVSLRFQNVHALFDAGIADTSRFTCNDVAHRASRFAAEGAGKVGFRHDSLEDT